jgi:hypothetical protein
MGDDHVRRGTLSMDSPRTDTPVPSPEAIEFVRFCYRRRRVGWPELYDEMCAVVGRSLFRGYGADELAGIGISLCLGDMPGLAALAQIVIGEEHPVRRPIAIRIVTDDGHAAGPADSTFSGHEPVERPDSGGSLRRLSAIPAGA